MEQYFTMMNETHRLFLREMNEDDNDTLYSVLANSEIMQHYPLQLFIFRKRQWSTRYTQFAMILAGVLLGQILYFCAPFGANTAQ